MKIFVFKLRDCTKYLIAAALLVLIVAFIASLHPPVIGVFNDSKELPIYSVESSSKDVAITFDCAWGAQDIPDILEILKKNDVKATFFIVGQWAEKFPEVVRQIAQGGHDIANHSYSHLRMGAIDSGRVSSEISLCGEKLKKITGNKVELFRAPYGDYNNTVVREAKSLGYYTIQWDVDSLDWKPGISQESIISRISQRVKPGSIILFHNDTVHTATILPSVIKMLKDQGYNLQPVSKMILRDNYYMDYDGTQRVNK